MKRTLGLRTASAEQVMNPLEQTSNRSARTIRRGESRIRRARLGIGGNLILPALCLRAIASYSWAQLDAVSTLSDCYVQARTICAMATRDKTIATNHSGFFFVTRQIEAVAIATVK